MNASLDSRKLGFGTHDAANRDEFTSHIRTEQYRELLKVHCPLRPRFAEVLILFSYHLLNALRRRTQ